ncbi:TetR/AcrR family transcriptional regulator [Lacticaseibacillus hulanensis]|uniref:TetR/AcrR family transcriptional regulator n=1 Tax=Lacticaseibacillus hulanensis TaxID=2493111 RepID=UPI000FD9FC74|nr:TetR/AcrR family transcriptional regulator [Lacticaseibacillus hulanensis]
MTQRSDLSREQLKDALAELLLIKPLDAITVRKLVLRAGVARSTFYRNFDDKDDFLRWLQNDLLLTAASTFAQDNDNPGPNFLVFYQFAEKKRNFMRAFLTGQRWPEFVHQLYASACQRYEARLAGRQQEIPLRPLIAFLVGGHVNLFLDWLQSDNPQTPAEMAAYHHRLGHDGLLKTFNINLE